VLSWTATPQMLSVAAYFMVSALLLVAPRAVVELQRSRHHRSRTDADQLADITPLPAFLWLPFSGCSLWPVWPVSAGCCCRPGNNFGQDKSPASFVRALQRYSLSVRLQNHFGVSGLAVIEFFVCLRSIRKG